MNPKDVILKMASLVAIIFAIYIILLGIHQQPVINAMYYLMAGIIIVGAIIVMAFKVE